MFQKRHEKSLRWVTDETNRREKSYGIVEAIKSGRVTEDSLEKSLSRMHQARPERLPSMTSVIKQISPWEAAAGGKGNLINIFFDIKRIVLRLTSCFTFPLQQKNNERLEKA